MTFEALFVAIAHYKIPILFLMGALPWVTYLLCYSIPGQWEEAFLLSVNLSVGVISVMLWSGYLAYTTNLGGWQQVVQQADILLLFLPLYYLAVSLWLSRLRMPLSQIPAFRTLQGLAIMAGVYLMLSWLASRIYIVFFSYLPFQTFLVLLAVILGFGYLGYRRAFG